jgi:hypothetical protein
VRLEHDILQAEHAENENNLWVLARLAIGLFSHVHYASGELECAQQQTSWRSVAIAIEVLRRAKQAITRFTHDHGAMILGA